MSLPRRPAFLLLLAFMAALIALRALGWLQPQDAALTEGTGKNVSLEARVVSPLKTELQGSKCVLRTASGARVEGFFGREWLAERIPLTGQSAVFHGKLRRPRPARNPGEFDEAEFLADRGIGWVLEVGRVGRVAPAPWSWLPAAWAEHARRSIEVVFARTLSSVDARILDGIVLGDKGPLPRDLNAAVQDAGVMHLLVPSGAKVGLIFLAAAGLAWLLGLSPWVRWALAAGLAGAYTLMVGGEPPYARAYWCALALGAGLASGRECAPFDALVLSAWAVLLWAPRDLFSLGFQMTYAAALGLCLALPRLRAAVSESWPRPARWAAEAVLVSAVVQALLAPLLAAAFGRISLVAVLANVALVPLASAAMGAGLILWACAGLPCAVWALAPIDGALARFFAIGCRWFASWPWAAVAVSSPAVHVIAAYYLALGAALAWPRRAAAAGLAAIAAFLVLAPRVWARASAPASEVTYLALPKGEAALLTLGGRETWLIEGGAQAGPILRALKARGVSIVHVVADRSPASDRALTRLSAFAPGASVERRGSFEWRQGRVTFGFWPPRVRNGPSEFDMILIRRRFAVTAATDGTTLQIRKASD